MKTLQESININEAREIEYRVTFLGFNEDGDNFDLPTTVKILVPREHARAFDNFLENEQDNIFGHAVGSSVEY